MLKNSSRELITSQKCLLYRFCILPIALYVFPLQYYNKAPLAYPLKKLGNMQQRAAIQILRAFQTSLSFSIEAIAGLIPIHLHLQKLSSRLQLRTQLLLPNYIIKFMLESRHSNINNDHHLLLEKLTLKQQLNVKGPIVDANNRLNGIFHSFNSFSSEFSLGDRLIDIFPNCFSFHLLDRKNKESKRAYICRLDELILQTLDKSKIAIVVSDTSIKNQVAISITHIHIYNNPIIKTLHHTINVTSTEAELFIIRYGINKTTQVVNINHIVVIIDSIYIAKRIFDSSIHPYQV